jgi:hypothetical protein
MFRERSNVESNERSVSEFKKQPKGRTGSEERAGMVIKGMNKGTAATAWKKEKGREEAAREELLGEARVQGQHAQTSSLSTRNVPRIRRPICKDTSRLACFLLDSRNITLVTLLTEMEFWPYDGPAYPGLGPPPSQCSCLV